MRSCRLRSRAHPTGTSALKGGCAEPSPQSPPAAQRPFDAQQKHDGYERPPSVPQIALRRFDSLLCRVVQPRQHTRGIGGANVASARVARKPAQEAFVQSRIGKLPIGAADVDRAIRGAETRRSTRRLNVNAMQASFGRSEGGGEVPWRIRATYGQRLLLTV